ncbi:hypothetical protein HRED_09272 [Candidatus Haloredivivus sp. G17]|nr:hypothetical protein HRED_09272 [Candidatus Haloredivivus sp. G17]
MVFANSSKIGQHKEGILKTSESVSRPGVKKHTFFIIYLIWITRSGKKTDSDG